MAAVDNGADLFKGWEIAFALAQCAHCTLVHIGAHWGP